MSFTAIREQGAATNALAHAVAAGRVASSYLFIGPEGVGRTSAARALAAALNCEEKNPEGCGRCRQCRLTAADSHADVRIWRKPEDKTVFPVDLIRDIADSLMLRSYEGGWKMAIIDGADLMNQEAANAFLKTLEEPPPRTVIVLIVTNPDLLPETIGSRSQKVFFRPLSDRLVGELLARDVSGKPADQAFAVLMAEGSMGAARDFLDKSWTKARHDAAGMLEWATEGKAAHLHPAVAGYTARENAERLVKVLEKLLRLAWRRRLGLRKEIGGVPGPLDTLVARIGDRLDEEAAVIVLEAAHQARQLLRGNVNPRLVVEGLLLAAQEALEKKLAKSGLLR